MDAKLKVQHLCSNTPLKKASYLEILCGDGKQCAATGTERLSLHSPSTEQRQCEAVHQSVDDSDLDPHLIEIFWGKPRPLEEEQDVEEDTLAHAPDAAFTQTPTKTAPLKQTDPPHQQFEHADPRVQGPHQQPHQPNTPNPTECIENKLEELKKLVPYQQFETPARSGG